MIVLQNAMSHYCCYLWSANKNMGVTKGSGLCPVALAIGQKLDPSQNDLPPNCQHGQSTSNPVDTKTFKET